MGSLSSLGYCWAYKLAVADSVTRTDELYPPTEWLLPPHPTDVAQLTGYQKSSKRDANHNIGWDLGPKLPAPSVNGYLP
jgi:hypothetical protein